jgi:hypothetical protein
MFDDFSHIFKVHFFSKHLHLYILSPKSPVTKKKGTPRTPTGIRQTSLDSITFTPRHELSDVSLTRYNSRITVQNYTMQLPITQVVRPNLRSHNTKTIQHVTLDWTFTMHLHSQTSRTDTIWLHKSTSCLLFHRKHSDSTSFQTLAII